MAARMCGLQTTPVSSPTIDGVDFPLRADMRILGTITLILSAARLTGGDIGNPPEKSLMSPCCSVDVVLPRSH